MGTTSGRAPRVVGNFSRPTSFIRIQKWGGDDGHRNGVLCADRDVTRGCYVVCGQCFDRLRAARGQTAQANHFLDGPQGEADRSIDSNFILAGYLHGSTMYNQTMDRVLYFLTAMTLAVGIALGISLWLL